LRIEKNFDPQISKDAFIDLVCKDNRRFKFVIKSEITNYADQILKCIKTYSFIENFNTNYILLFPFNRKPQSHCKVKNRNIYLELKEFPRMGIDFSSNVFSLGFFI